jgi:aromatic ring-opening dioxygenase LigB subunit
MPIVIGAVAPHGIRTIPLLSETADGAMGTRQALLELGRRFEAAKLDVLFISGPHGVRVNGFVSLSDTGRGAGTAHWRGRTVELNVPMDREFAALVAEKAQGRGVPVAQIGFGGTNPPTSVLALDWSAIVPAWFAAYQVNMVGYGHPLSDPPADLDQPGRPKLVVANPSRMLPRESNLEFGRAVAEAANASGKRVGFIASCDWSHTHVDSHRFRHHPAAKEVDALVVQAIQDNDIARLITLDEEQARNAAIDGLWQALMLAGAQQVTPMDVDFLSYEVAEYFGMIVATFQPQG